MLIRNPLFQKNKTIEKSADEKVILPNIDMQLRLIGDLDVERKDILKKNELHLNLLKGNSGII